MSREDIKKETDDLVNKSGIPSSYRCSSKGRLDAQILLWGLDNLTSQRKSREDVLLVLHAALEKGDVSTLQDTCGSLLM
jgi:hypothetical protein